MRLKGILVAGGRGSRLYPFTRFTHKSLLPLHRRPVIDFALGTMRRAGITDFTIIGNQFIGQVSQHVGTGLDGEIVSYVIEEEPRGVGHALNLARPHTQNCRLMIYFADNITTAELNVEVSEWRDADEPPGCLLLGRSVENPSSFGVAVLDDSGGLVDIIEKPREPPSNIAIGGIYLYDERFWEILDRQMTQNGDEFTISDVNRRYIELGAARMRRLITEEWYDCGTPDSLLQAAQLARDGRLNPEPCNIRQGDPEPKPYDK